MKSYNQVIFKGVLGRDAEVRNYNGKDVANFSVATEYSRKGQDGKWQKETTWLNVVAWSGYGVCGFGQLRKGAKVSGSGRLRGKRHPDRVDNRELEVLCDSLDVIAEEQEDEIRGDAASTGIQERTREDLPF